MEFETIWNYNNAEIVDNADDVIELFRGQIADHVFEDFDVVELVLEIRSCMMKCLIILLKP